MKKQKMTDKEKQDIASLITAIVNDSIHYGSYERIGIEGKPFDVDFIKYLENHINVSVERLANYIETAINSRT